MSVMRRWLVLALSGCLAACATQSVRPPPLSPDQLARLTALEQWTLQARLGLSDGEQGGSGRLDWTQGHSTSELRFHGAFGQGSWRLQVTPELARLELADDESYSAGTLDELLRDTIGWELPVAALVWWVRGLPAPDAPYQAVAFEDHGSGPSTVQRLQRLEQFGWTVEYAAFTDVDGLQLPRKLSATRGADEVKLVIRRWLLAPA